MSKYSGLVGYGEGGIINSLAKKMTLWHGSPYRFNKFDMSKIGAGENTANEGHGLYFTESPKAAEFYKQQDTPNLQDHLSPVLFEGRPYSEIFQHGMPGKRALDLITSRGIGKDPIGFAEDYLRKGVNWPGYREDLDWLLKNRESISLPQPATDTIRNLVNRPTKYKIEVDRDPESFLDFYRPLSAQTEKVRKSLFQLDPSLKSDRLQPMMGHQVYHHQSPDDYKEASRLLNNHGVSGIRYPGAQSDSDLPGSKRSGIKDYNNYVLFDDQGINIVRKYDNGGLVGYAIGGGVEQSADPYHLPMPSIAPRSTSGVTSFAPVPSVNRGTSGVYSFGHPSAAHSINFSLFPSTAAAQQQQYAAPVTVPHYNSPWVDPALSVADSGAAGNSGASGDGGGGGTSGDTNGDGVAGDAGPGGGPTGGDAGTASAGVSTDGESGPPSTGSDEGDSGPGGGPTGSDAGTSSAGVGTGSEGDSGGGPPGTGGEGSGPGGGPAGSGDAGSGGDGDFKGGLVGYADGGYTGFRVPYTEEELAPMPPAHVYDPEEYPQNHNLRRQGENHRATHEEAPWEHAKIAGHLLKEILVPQDWADVSMMALGPWGKGLKGAAKVAREGTRVVGGMNLTDAIGQGINTIGGIFGYSPNIPRAVQTTPAGGEGEGHAGGGFVEDQEYGEGGLIRELMKLAKPSLGAYHEYLREAPIGIDRRMSAPKILKEGRFKSLFETGTSGGANIPRLRKDLEDAMFGVPRDVDDAERPIYGSLRSAEKRHSFPNYKPHPWQTNYGDTTFLLNQGAKDHSTYTLGDSLALYNQANPSNGQKVTLDMFENQDRPRAFNGPMPTRAEMAQRIGAGHFGPEHARKEIDLINNGNHYLENFYPDYTETQTRGPVTMKDVLAILHPEHGSQKKLINGLAKERGIPTFYHDDVADSPMLQRDLRLVLGGRKPYRQFEPEEPVSDLADLHGFEPDDISIPKRADGGLIDDQEYGYGGMVDRLRTFLEGVNKSLSGVPMSHSTSDENLAKILSSGDIRSKRELPDDVYSPAAMDSFGGETYRKEDEEALGISKPGIPDHQGPIYGYPSTNYRIPGIQKVNNFALGQDHGRGGIGTIPREMMYPWETGYGPNTLIVRPSSNRKVTLGFGDSFDGVPGEYKIHPDLSRPITEEEIRHYIPNIEETLHGTKESSFEKLSKRVFNNAPFGAILEATTPGRIPLSEISAILHDKNIPGELREQIKASGIPAFTHGQLSNDHVLRHDLGIRDSMPPYGRNPMWQAPGADKVRRADGGMIDDQEYGEGGLIDLITKGLRAYHGSPHVFDRFDLSKMGSGEGAQAFGKGHYFAQREPVAQGYRERGLFNEFGKTKFNLESPFRVEYNNPEIQKRMSDEFSMPDLEQLIHPHSDHGDLAYWLKENGHVANDVDINDHTYHSPEYRDKINLESRLGHNGRIEIMDDLISSGGHEFTPRQIRFFQEMLKESRDGKYQIVPNRGAMYETKLHAEPDRLLNLDKPLDLWNQSRHVLTQLNRLGEMGGQGVRKAIDNWGYSSSPQERIRGLENGVNRDFFTDPHVDTNSLMSPNFHEIMSGLGVQGSRFRDGFSRSENSDPTHNFVMFSDDPVEITKRYAQGGILGSPTQPERPDPTASLGEPDHNDPSTRGALQALMMWKVA